MVRCPHCLNGRMFLDNYLKIYVCINCGFQLEKKKIGVKA